MSNDKLLGALKVSENKNKTRIERIRKEFNESRYKFSKLKIKEIRKNLYEIENEENLDENLSKTNKYYDYDDIKYRGIRDVRNLFDLSTGEDYYKPIIANSAFNNNCIQYESKGDKDKILTISEYLDMIKPYLVDMIKIIKIKVNGKFSYQQKSVLFLLNQILMKHVLCIQKVIT